MLIVDPLTGAMYKLPNNVNITLSEQAEATLTAIQIHFTTIDSLDAEQRARLERMN